MAGGCGGGGGGAARRAAARARTVRALVRDTQRALSDVTDVLQFEPEVGWSREVGGVWWGGGGAGDASGAGAGALVLLGGGEGRARLLHALLGRRLLPHPPPTRTRWVRIQYGSATSARLTLGSSGFELVEPLACQCGPWDTLPIQDLIRQDQTDMATVLEVELNNPFLKDGLKIIIPPDIGADPHTTSFTTLKQQHSQLYAKRELILKSFNPIYLYAIDKIGKRVFSENFFTSRIVTSRSEEDFWTTFNLYHMYSGGGDGGSEVGDGGDGGETRGDRFLWQDSSEPAVFSSEDCLDLHQIKEIDPNAQVLFVLFADSKDIISTRDTHCKCTCDVIDSSGKCACDVITDRCLCGDVTESTEFTECVFREEELPESDQGLIRDGMMRHRHSPKQTIQNDRRLYEEQMAFMNELLDQWELMSRPPPKHHVKSQWIILDDCELVRGGEHRGSGGARRGKHGDHDHDRVVSSRTRLLSVVVKFATDCLHTYLLEHCTKLSEVHVQVVQQLVVASWGLARELQAVPRRLHYAATRERLLHQTMVEKFSSSEQQQELVRVMADVLQELRDDVRRMDWSGDDLPCHQDHNLMISNSVFYASSRSSEGQVSVLPHPANTADPTPSDGEEAESYDSHNFDDYEIIHSDDESLRQYGTFIRRGQDLRPLPSGVDSIAVENEASAGWGARAAGPQCAGPSVSAKQASLLVQQAVLSRLSHKISLKLVKFVDCLKDSYFGTLQRCVESLEEWCVGSVEGAGEGGRAASAAARRLLGAARRIHLQPHAPPSLLHDFLESLRRLFNKVRAATSGAGAGAGAEAGAWCCPRSAAWRRRVALQTAHSLSAPRLARIISAQILERLNSAHESYQSALGALESALTNRLHHTEEVKLAIRKKYAPRFARLCLESTSMCDLLMYGAPELGREIGRGQYGVVFAARGAWAGRSPVAVKSVLPADDRHYHELAMEFFYTRSIPAHERIVRLHGSIVQRGGGSGGGGPCVLLISERRTRDLHAAVRAGLAFAKRMRVSLDIMEGIRYLHSLGLVHRDIKMKNVLLDAADRAALTDLGFCAAEALISGSVVGTPVHMAPELLAGAYDASVDVYAFGILFWYVCAGNVKLPTAFELFQNKEQLWSKVKKGLRPERLPHFWDECWEVMESCWAAEPSRRALPGHLQPKLEAILARALAQPEPSELPDAAVASGGDDGSVEDSENHSL